MEGQSDENTSAYLLAFTERVCVCLFKEGFPLDEFIRANRIFSSLTMCSFDITSLYAYVSNSLQRKKE